MPMLASGFHILPLLLFFVFLPACNNSEAEAERDPSVLYERSVESQDGVPIAYQIKGNGYPVIVLVHGWSCDRRYWRKQFDVLTEHYTVVSIDLAGHGQSGDSREQYTMQAFGADITAVAEKEMLRGLLLTGHSMGGAAVLEAARQMPGRVLGIIGVDTYHDIISSFRTAEIDSFITNMRKDFTGTTRPWIRDMFATGADTSLVNWVVKDMSSAKPDIAVNAFRHYTWYHHATVFREVARPVYLLNSDHWPTKLAPLRQLAPHAAMTILPGLGHFPMLENPALFLANFTTAVNYIRTHPAKK